MIYSQHLQGTVLYKKLLSRRSKQRNNNNNHNNNNDTTTKSMVLQSDVDGIEKQPQQYHQYQQQQQQQQNPNNVSYYNTITNNVTTTTNSIPTITYIAAGLYIGSGICQPLLMQVCKIIGLADPYAQLYMLAYYIGPACLIFTLQKQRQQQQQPSPRNSKRKQHKQQQQQYNTIHEIDNDNEDNDDSNDNDEDSGTTFPSTQLIVKASGIALFDIAAQSINYTGAGLAGATIFAVIYSSVTIWTALFSYLWFHRQLTFYQWCAVLLVFGGLCITALDSINLGPDVIRGTIFIIFGSCMHGATYVMSEAIMTTSVGSIKKEQLSIRQNTAIQGSVASFGLFLWQLVYTIPRWDRIIYQPMQTAGTTIVIACVVMVLFAITNLIHAITFFYTLKYYPGGSTSAGIMKGLQAVLVFVVAHYIFCHQNRSGGGDGGEGMCFTYPKLISLLTVVSGVLLFSSTKQQQPEQQQQQQYRSTTSSEVPPVVLTKSGYTPIPRSDVTI